MSRKLSPDDVLRQNFFFDNIYKESDVGSRAATMRPTAAAALRPAAAATTSRTVPSTAAAPPPLTFMN